MQFRDLRRQYEYLKDEIDKEILDVINSASFISGKQVEKLEKQLAEFDWCESLYNMWKWN